MRHSKSRLIVVGLAAILTLVLSSTYLYPVVRSWAVSQTPPQDDPEPEDPQGPVVEEDPHVVPEPEPVAYVHPKVKGIYVSAHIAATPKLLDELLSWVNETELNGVVIDVKDDFGKIPWLTEVPLAAASNLFDTRLKKIDELMERLESMDVYPIARLVTFKDPGMALAKPDWAVKNAAGGVWLDNKGHGWLDPYNRDAWEYLVDVAREAASKGFKEIQFDYVRFPSDGKLSNIVYKHATEATRSESIRDFLKYAKTELEPLGVKVSADIFGLVTVVRTNDMGIGQVLEDIYSAVDVVSPMVYPEHYAPNTFGIADPDKEPYLTVLKSMQAAKERLEATEYVDSIVMRPWLQDFTIRHKYGVAEIKAQIKAVEDAGFEEWLLWDPRCRYTKDAFSKITP